MYLKFKDLHKGEQPLILGNVWNVQSAKVFEKLNFQAIGTSSAAIAHSLGYEDGEHMPFSDLLFIVERIRKSVQLPLSVDIEFGYGETAAEIASNIIALERIGVVGINIEDSFIENEQRKLKEMTLFTTILKKILDLLKKEGISIFVNVRSDAYLLNLPNALEESIKRVKAYEAIGVDGIFLPCITSEEEIKEIVLQTTLPVNVMCVPRLPNFKKLAMLGVKRISMGNLVNDYASQSMSHKIEEILTVGSFDPLF